MTHIQRGTAVQRQRPLGRALLMRAALVLVAASAACAQLEAQQIEDAYRSYSCPMNVRVPLVQRNLAACYGKVGAGEAATETRATLLRMLVDSAPLNASADPAAAARLAAGLPRPARDGAARYNTLIGSTQIGDNTYRFTADPNPLEGAKRMLAAGARVHKFSLRTFSAAAGRQATSMLDAATDRAMGYADIFDLPLTRYVFWAYPVVEANAYREYYDLAVHLITRFRGTGKAFYLGHWEGDWSIRSQYVDPVLPDRVALFVTRLSAMQLAIDTAKADYAPLLGGEAGVKIWGYAEVNRVLGSMADPTYKSFVNQVLPFIDPPIDFVSYSNWEIEEARERSADELGPVLQSALDFIDCHVPPKPCVPEPRTFIGEFGYFLRSKNCSALLAPPVVAGAGPYADTTPEVVASRSMWHLAQAVAWGSPFNHFWQLYSNEKGQDPATGARCDRGFWLVDSDGADAPVMAAHKAYFSAASEYVTSYAAARGGATPDVNTFRRWAVAKLVDLAGYYGSGGKEGGGVMPPAPAFRELDLGAAKVAGGH
ncbi:MAG: hypothetical protein J3K34DRAFT_277261 [Monoraphidium minutum]|nr:MAG: hypothetical protein J3K34DRAFT_277261 [Monoraphidium minutum]